jgi:hypothetical protein
MRALQIYVVLQVLLILGITPLMTSIKLVVLHPLRESHHLFEQSS